MVKREYSIKEFILSQWGKIRTLWKSIAKFLLTPLRNICYWSQFRQEKTSHPIILCKIHRTRVQYGELPSSIEMNRIFMHLFMCGTGVFIWQNTEANTHIWDPVLWHAEHPSLLVHQVSRRFMQLSFIEVLISNIVILTLNKTLLYKDTEVPGEPCGIEFT